MGDEQEVGVITHYYPKIGVAVIELRGTLRSGETIRIKGATTDFTQPVGSMQIEHEQVDEAKKGESIGMKVDDNVRPQDKVFVVEE